jgi:molybdopterin-biosynthesis enzyme MoeA-like protein
MAGAASRQAGTAEGSAISPQQVGGDPGFIQKHHLGNIAILLPGLPLIQFSGYVCSLL